MRVMRYLLQYKGALVAVFALLLLMAFCELSLPRYTAAIVDNVVAMAAVGQSGDSLAELMRLGAFMLLFALGLVACSVAIGLIASVTGARIARDLRQQLYEKVMAFSPAEVEGFSAASLITRSTNDVQQMQMVAVMLLRVVLYAPILAVGGIFMVVQTNASMGWVIALAVVAVFVVVIALLALTMPKFKIMQSLVDRLNLVSREILTGISVIRAFGRQGREQERFEEANRDLMETQLFTMRAMLSMMPALSLIMNLVSVGIVWVGGHYIAQGSMQTGDLIAFITYAMVIIMSFLMIGMVSVMLPRAEVAAGRIEEVLNTPFSVSDPANPRDAELEELAACSDGIELAFDDVSFSYSPDSDPVLDHVSFTAPAGMTTAVIGSTGSGKSTVIKLLERFYDVQGGAVTVGGIDVRELSQGCLRSVLGYSPQQAFLFSGTVESNVGYADPQMPRQRVDAAVDVAQAREFVEQREEGMQAAVSQGGTNVSGGQRQRLSIARALAADARAYLFDDSFSALDYSTDAKLREGLSRQMRGKTLLIVAQRIATIMHADRIVVLEDGRVVGTGTHGELMERCPAYRQIALSQLSPAELEKGGAR
ncbi:MAG: ABC transporter ATP-binding protein [Coriobacteriales bacterium]